MKMVVIAYNPQKGLLETESAAEGASGGRRNSGRLRLPPFLLPPETNNPG